MNHPHRWMFLLATALASCAAPVARLDLGEPIEVRYEGAVSPRAAAQPSPAVAEAPPAKLPAPADSLVVRSYCIELPAALAWQALGITQPAWNDATTLAAPRGWHLNEPSVASAMSSLGSHGEYLAAPTVVVHPGQEARIEVLGQRAFISGFTLQPGGDQLLPEPQVDTWETALAFTVRVEGTGDEARLDCSFQCTDPVQPAATASIALGRELSLELPVALDQRLGTSTKVAKGGAIVMGPIPAPGSSRVRILCVEVAPSAAGPVSVAGH